MNTLEIKEYRYRYWHSVSVCNPDWPRTQRFICWMLNAGTEGVCPYTQQRMILDSRNRKSIKTDREKERGLKEIIQIIQSQMWQVLYLIKSLRNPANNCTSYLCKYSLETWFVTTTNKDNIPKCFPVDKVDLYRI